MAQAMASMAGSNRLIVPGGTRISLARPGLVIRAQQQQVPAAEPETSSRRAVLGLVAAGLASGSFVQAVLAEAKSIKLRPPPPPSGGLRKSFFLPLFVSSTNKY